MSLAGEKNFRRFEIDKSSNLVWSSHQYSCCFKQYLKNFLNLYNLQAELQKAKKAKGIKGKAKVLDK